MRKYGILAILIFLWACQSSNTGYPTLIAESPSPTLEEILLPEASGTSVISDDDQVVLADYSNAKDGYIMVKTLTADHQPLVILIIKDEQQYRYDLNADEQYECFPLNMGDGTYQVKIGEKMEDNRYAVILSWTFEAELTGDTIPYLYPNQVVDYDQSTQAVLLSFELTKDAKTTLQRVYNIYNYVISNIDYDYDKLQAAQTDYILPILDETLSSRKGICFDYAALMSAMLRVQQIPTKVITGYVDDGYHAWVEVYVANEGWINPELYFAEDTWNRADPTYAAANYDYQGSYTEVYEY
ncbi:MAG: transglutaminase-like domain-containing protein [Erysipelotrichaceae bacterium]|nr:transglutaminase-like domain-containing protein [Erysipelotrichaceae bacterium]